MTTKPKPLQGAQWAVLAPGATEGEEEVVCCVTLHDVACWGCTCGAWQWCPHIAVLWAFLGLPDPLAELHTQQEGGTDGPSPTA
jgi:hypothetical protein